MHKDIEIIMTLYLSRNLKIDVKRNDLNHCIFIPFFFIMTKGELKMQILETCVES